MDLAALVIIDVSVPSTNIEWEVNTATQRHGPCGLLLIQAEEKAKDLVEWSQEEGWAILRYDMSRAADELAAFSQSWREEKHQLVDPDASLGPIGSAIASAIKEWMRHPEFLHTKQDAERHSVRP